MLQSNVRSLYGSVASTAQMQLSQARKFITTALATARSTGYLPDQDDLSFAMQTAMGGLDARNYSSAFEMDRDRLILAGELAGLQEIAGEQLTDAQRQLAQLEKQTSRLDDILSAAERAISGNEEGFLSVEEAINNLSSALGFKLPGTTFSSKVTNRPGFVKVPGAGGITVSEDRIRSDNRGSYIGPRTPILPSFTSEQSASFWDFALEAVQNDPAFGAMQGFTDAFNTGATNSNAYKAANAAVTALQDESQAYWASLPSFDVGTNFVPQDMVARIHAGEAIVPREYNPWAGGVMYGSDELRLIREEISALRMEQQAQAVASQSTKTKMLKKLELWDGDGMPEERVVA
jgi:hypothetical protein